MTDLPPTAPAAPNPITINTTTPAITEIGTPPPVKPGWQTSEFRLGVAAFALTALYASGVIPTSGPWASVAAIAATILGSLGYTVSRTLVKVGASKGTAVTSQTATSTQMRAIGTLVPMLAIFAFALGGSGCAASTRATTLQATVVGANASAAAFVLYDKGETAAIAADAEAASKKATTFADGAAAIAAGRAKLAAYQASTATINKALIAVYNAIAIAQTLNDDPSLAGAQRALVQLVSAVVAITGGGK